MFNFILLLSNTGNLRLQKYYKQIHNKDSILTFARDHIINRPDNATNFMWFGQERIIYKRYASLYIIGGIEDSDNELVKLQELHRFVELLDAYWVNVCELDVVFGQLESSWMLDELIIGGELGESSLQQSLKQSKNLEEKAAAELSIQRKRERKERKKNIISRIVG